MTIALSRQGNSRSQSRADWRVGVAVAGAAAALFAAYCFAHGWLDGGSLAPDASLRWGLLAGAPAGGLSWLLWSLRERLADYAFRSLVARAILLAGILLLLLIGGPVLHGLAAQQPLNAFPHIIVQQAFDLLPLGIAAIAALGAALIATRRSQAGPQPPLPQWLSLSDEPKLVVKRADVAVLRAAGNYCEVHTSARVHLIRSPIKVMAARLAPYGYLRVHRSTLINLERLRAVENRSGTVVAQMDDGSRVTVGRAFKADLEAALARSSQRSDIYP